MVNLEESKDSGNIRVFLVNQEFHRDFCRKNGIIIGTNITMVYYRGQNMLFVRGLQDPVDKLKGLLNPTQLEELVKSARAAIDMGLREIHVPF